MASGILGQAALAAVTNTPLYTVPAGKLATFGVNLVNRAGSAISVRLAVATSGTPTDAQWLIYDFPLAANGVLERSGLVAEAGRLVVVYASAVGVSATVFGLED